MRRIVRGGLIQATLCEPASSPVEKIKAAMIDKQIAMIEEAVARGAQVICLQEMFYGPYFCAEQNEKWYGMAERVPDGPTIRQMQEQAKRHQIVMIVPVYEEEMPGLYYNAAAVIDAGGEYLGKFRKVHIPQCAPGFWEKYYFRPGNLGYPIFDTRVGRIAVYICYDRHFPEGARCLGLQGAEIVFNPSATVAGLSEHLWKLEQPAHAVANQYFVAAVNRPGVEAPWNIGEFYGQSYICNPRGEILAEGCRTDDDIVLADMDLDTIRDVRHTWQFFRDRRPETYRPITDR